ncbi:MAG: epoxyqueuosine reductase QueH [Lachnospiraceae bacterium]|nr:epoxyqueuosine reductase QueH [Lachnospiraceae bacterium]
MKIMKVNYQTKLEEILSLPDTKGKSLLLHSCCAPCSSYVLEYLQEYFRITVFFYNPNITDSKEYNLRLNEQKRLIPLISGSEYPIGFRDGGYDINQFHEMTGKYPQSLEGGERCLSCYELRLNETARITAAEKYDCFATTLTISPHKNAEKINEIGERVAALIKVNYLPADFKKKGGYQRSLELSKQYSLYRQSFCGCEMSKP